MDMEEYLRQFRLSDPEPELRGRLLAAAAKASETRLRFRRSTWIPMAAAAVILLGIGIWGIVGGRKEPVVVKVPPELTLVAILNGRGQVRPVDHSTNFALVNEAGGQVRLNAGEIVVELPPDAGLQAEVATVAGTITTRATSCCAHYAASTPGGTPYLAVTVRGGFVEVANAQGRAVGESGDIIVAELGAAPETHGDVPKTSQGKYYGGCPFANALGLIYHREVQQELHLTDAQRERLQRPGKNELRETCEFFRGLRDRPRGEWADQASAFCRNEQRRLTEVLTRDQYDRLNQIHLRQEGLFAVARPEVIDALGLTAAQQTALEAIFVDYGRASRALITQHPLPPDAAQQMAMLRQKASDAIAALLTDTQHQAWQQMLGQPFTLPPAHHGPTKN